MSAAQYVFSRVGRSDFRPDNCCLSLLSLLEDISSLERSGSLCPSLMLVCYLENLWYLFCTNLACSFVIFLHYFYGSITLAQCPWWSKANKQVLTETFFILMFVSCSYRKNIHVKEIKHSRNHVTMWNYSFIFECIYSFILLFLAKHFAWCTEFSVVFIFFEWISFFFNGFIDV